MTSRAESWASTMHGHASDDATDVRLAHSDSWAGSGVADAARREDREASEDAALAPLATHRARIAGSAAQEAAGIGVGPARGAGARR